MPSIILVLLLPTQSEIIEIESRGLDRHLGRNCDRFEMIQYNYDCEEPLNVANRPRGRTWRAYSVLATLSLAQERRCE